jgi:hypothetical protein
MWTRLKKEKQMSKNHEINISGVPEQNTLESLEGLKNSEVRNLNNQEVQTTDESDRGRDKTAEVNHSPGEAVHESSSPTSSHPNKDMKSEIGAALSRCFSNFLKDWVNATEYQGYCWIPKDDFDSLCDALSGVSTVGCFSMQDKQMLREIDEWGPSDLIHVRVFSTLRDRKGHRPIEVSGTLSLGVLRDDTGAYMIGGITGEDPINVKFHITPYFSELKKYSIEDELAPLFRIPSQYGNMFKRFKIGTEHYESKDVSRYQAEQNLVAALQRTKLPKSEIQKKDKGKLICDSCGDEAGPDAEVTETFKQFGVHKGKAPLRALHLMSVNGEILAVCSSCSQALLKKEEAA